MGVRWAELGVQSGMLVVTRRLFDTKLLTVTQLRLTVIDTEKMGHGLTELRVGACCVTRCQWGGLPRGEQGGEVVALMHPRGTRAVQLCRTIAMAACSAAQHSVHGMHASMQFK